MPEKDPFYIAARGGFNRDGSARVALLAGPYATRQEAEQMVKPVSHWAAEHSGDQWACFYEYAIITLPEGLATSKLGSITPEALGLLRGKESSSTELAAALFGGDAAAPEKSTEKQKESPARAGADHQQGGKHGLKSAADFMQRRGQVQDRFHATQVNERELGGLVPPATGPRPESGGDQQTNQRAPPGRESPGRRR